MKKIFSVMMALAAVVFVSCGKGGLKPESTEVVGKLKDCYEVVSKNYELKESLMDKMISVELVRTDKELPFDPEYADPFGVTDVYHSTHVGFGIEFLDKDGNVLEMKNATAGGMSGPYSYDDITRAMNAEPGEKFVIRWTLSNSTGEKATSFRITSAIER